ncbi:unnamed protein product [Amoebophrya sp. A120]|nr:unnamed protein product [Amoebophrya sp. A120]|eukprot:GSA120T00005234001.1
MDPVPVIFATQTGISEEFAQNLEEESAGKKVPFVATSVTSVAVDSLRETKLAVFICSSHGDGDPPDSACNFYNALTGERNKKALAHLRFALLGLGDQNYMQYQGFPISLQSALAALGATLVYVRGEADNAGDIDEDFENWKNNGFWDCLESEYQKCGGKPYFEEEDSSTEISTAPNSQNHADDTDDKSGMVLYQAASRPESSPLKKNDFYAAAAADDQRAAKAVSAKATPVASPAASPAKEPGLGKKDIFAVLTPPANNKVVATTSSPSCSSITSPVGKSISPTTSPLLTEQKNQILNNSRSRVQNSTATAVIFGQQKHLLAHVNSAGGAKKSSKGSTGENNHLSVEELLKSDRVVYCDEAVFVPTKAGAFDDSDTSDFARGLFALELQRAFARKETKHLFFIQNVDQVARTVARSLVDKSFGFPETHFAHVSACVLMTERQQDANTTAKKLVSVLEKLNCKVFRAASVAELLEYVQFCVGADPDPAAEKIVNEKEKKKNKQDKEPQDRLLSASASEASPVAGSMFSPQKMSMNVTSPVAGLTMTPSPPRAGSRSTPTSAQPKKGWVRSVSPRGNVYYSKYRGVQCKGEDENSPQEKFSPGAKDALPPSQRSSVQLSSRSVSSPISLARRSRAGDLEGFEDAPLSFENMSRLASQLHVVLDFLEQSHELETRAVQPLLAANAEDPRRMVHVEFQPLLSSSEFLVSDNVSILAPSSPLAVEKLLLALEASSAADEHDVDNAIMLKEHDVTINGAGGGPNKKAEKAKNGTTSPTGTSSSVAMKRKLVDVLKDYDEGKSQTDLARFLNALFVQTEEGKALLPRLQKNARVADLDCVGTFLGYCFALENFSFANIKQQDHANKSEPPSPGTTGSEMKLNSNFEFMQFVQKSRPYTLVGKTGICVTHQSFGQASTFLCCNCEKGTKVFAKLVSSPLRLQDLEKKSNVWKFLPSIDEKNVEPPPLLMIATGAGMGVFIGWLQEFLGREEKCPFHDVTLFAGCRTWDEVPYRGFLHQTLTKESFSVNLENKKIMDTTSNIFEDHKHLQDEKMTSTDKRTKTEDNEEANAYAVKDEAFLITSSGTEFGRQKFKFHWHQALSREGKKLYVQKLLQVHQGLLVEKLVAKKGFLYFCGEAKMIKECRDFLKQILPKQVFDEKRIIAEQWGTTRKRSRAGSLVV